MPASDLALQALNRHLDRMDDAATNSGLALLQLIDANVRLASATFHQYQTIEKLLTDIKLSSPPILGHQAPAPALVPPANNKPYNFFSPRLKISGSLEGSAPPTAGE